MSREGRGDERNVSSVGGPSDRHGPTTEPEATSLLTRRSFLATTGIALGGAVVLPGALRSSAKKSLASEAIAVRDQSLAGYSKANIDWKQAEGTTLVLAGESSTWWETYSPIFHVFEDLTGIKLTVQTSGETAYVSKLPVQLASGSPVPDVYLDWSYPQSVASHWAEPLSAYLHNPKLTDASWFNFGDVLPPPKAFVTWTDGEIYGLPVDASVETMFYRKNYVSTSLSTFEDVMNAARRAHHAGFAGIAMRGLGTAAAVAWPLGGFIFTYGGYIIDPAGRPALDSPQTIAAVAEYADMLKYYGPPGVTSWSFPQVISALEEDRCAIAISGAFALPYVLNSKLTVDNSEIIMTRFPSRGGVSRPNLFFWTLAMNTRSKNKIGSWLFMQWVTSYTTATLVTPSSEPARAAVYDSPKYKDFYGAHNAKVILESLKTADPKPFNLAWRNPNFTEVGNALGRATSAIISGEATPAAALRSAQRIAVAGLSQK